MDPPLERGGSQSFLWEIKRLQENGSTWATYFSKTFKKRISGCLLATRSARGNCFGGLRWIRLFLRRIG